MLDPGAQRGQLEQPPLERPDHRDRLPRGEFGAVEFLEQLAAVAGQRQDLNAIEEAQGYQSLIANHGHGQDAVGKLVGKSRSHVANLLRLLNLPASVQQMLVRGDIMMGHARALVAAEEPELLAKQIVAKGLSVRQAEQLAKRVKPGAGRDIGRGVERQANPVDSDLAALERQLGDLLGLKVKVTHIGAGGTVSLSYSSLDQLDMICQRLSGEPI